MADAVDRMSGELDELAEQITRRVFEEVDEYRGDPIAQAMLPPYVRLNLDQAMLALRGDATTTATARNVALADAVATGLSLDAVERTYQIARDVLAQRLSESAHDVEDLAIPLARLDGAHAMVVDAIRDEYRAAKRRIDRR